MIEHKTVVDQIELPRDGSIQIRFGVLQIVENIIVSRRWHRTAIAPGGDVEAQIGHVNEHLSQMGEAPVSAEEIARVKRIAASL